MKIMNDLKHYKGICYRFFNFEGAEKTLLTTELRFTRMDKLSDPFEGHIDKYLPAIREQQFMKMAAQEFPYSIAKQKEYASKHRRESKEIIAELEFERIAQRTFTCSFSKNYNDENSILLWSHYAANHTGICIGFNFEGHKGFKPFEVEYPKILEALCVNNLLNGVIKDELADKFLKIMLFQKHNCWKFENEVRLAFSQRILEDKELKIESKSEEEKYLNISIENDMISTIIFGLSTDSDNKEKIKQIVKNQFPNARLKEMYSTNKLELKSRDI